MVELTLFLILNLIGVFFTLLILIFKTIPENEKESSWKGLSFLAAVIATIIWLICAVGSLSVGTVSSYAAVVGGVVVTGSFSMVIPDTWPFVLVYCLVSIIPFILLIYLWPEAWLSKK
jgi:hypothetical protein